MLSGQRLVGRLAPDTDSAAADFLLRVMNAQGTLTLQAMEAEGHMIPLRPQDAVAAEGVILSAEREALAREQRILNVHKEIDKLVLPLFEAVSQPTTQSLTQLV